MGAEGRGAQRWGLAGRLVPGYAVGGRAVDLPGGEQLHGHGPGGLVRRARLDAASLRHFPASAAASAAPVRYRARPRRPRRRPERPKCRAAAAEPRGRGARPRDTDTSCAQQHTIARTDTCSPPRASARSLSPLFIPLFSLAREDRSCAPDAKRRLLADSRVSPSLAWAEQLRLEPASTSARALLPPSNFLVCLCVCTIAQTSLSLTCGRSFMPGRQIQLINPVHGCIRP